MEIYTNDFWNLCSAHAQRVENQLHEKGIKYSDYFIEDEFYNFKGELCRTINERLSEQFKQMVVDSKNPNFDLEKELFKTINELG